MHFRSLAWRFGIVVALTVVGAAVRGADWPQYRGPGRDGIAREGGLLESWAGGQPTVVWRRSIGTGYSAVSAVSDRLYTLDADEQREHALCLNAPSGETLWQVELGEFVQAELGDGGPRSTPTVVDGVVYAVSSQARLVALDAVDGRLLWDRDLTELGPVPRFGYAVSPLVDGGLVIVEVGESEKAPGVTAFDRKTGELRWSALQGPAGYSSALVAEIASVRQVLIFRAAGRELVSLSTSGELLWRHATPEALSAIAMPIFQAPDRIFLSTSEDAFGGRMLRVVGGTDSFRIEEVWSERLMRNHFNSSVLVGGYLYGFDNGTFRCLDAATGERRWAQRGLGKGSLVAAGDLLYVLGDGGTAALVRATPEGYREAGRLQVMEGRSWTSPSLADGRLYLRDFDEIVSLDIRGDAVVKNREEAP
jgi:outer membrane protein assembly factor BamB